jgi:NAD(P)-dependent dehydrogenase (short-subunit alcohol dehydrogenase family)
MQIDGQAAVVTGGASGLGLATAEMLASAGARLALLDVDAARVAEAAGRIGGLGLRCDVADAASAEQALASARAANGPAAILVNCAGIAAAKRIVGRDGPMPLPEFEQVIRVNLIGTFNLLRLAAADMIALEPNAEGERGVIVNTASVAAFDGQIGQAAYAASKGGVAALTLPTARELARHGIRVVTLRRASSRRRCCAVCRRRCSRRSARACRSPGASAGRRNTPFWSVRSSTTRC